jgi:hypothetical protein
MNGWVETHPYQPLYYKLAFRSLKAPAPSVFHTSSPLRMTSKSKRRSFDFAQDDKQEPKCRSFGFAALRSG